MTNFEKDPSSQAELTAFEGSPKDGELGKDFTAKDFNPNANLGYDVKSSEPIIQMNKIINVPGEAGVRIIPVPGHVANMNGFEPLK